MDPQPTASSSIPVCLPSIHEMFPDHLLRPDCHESDRSHSHRVVSEASDVHRYSSVSHSCNSSHRCCSHSPAPVPSRTMRGHLHSQTTNVAHSRSHDPRLAHSSFVHESEMIHPPGPRRRSASHVYSFDVLRSDPTSASLQHLTSSATFPNRAANPQQLGPNTVVGSGSSPAFRVSVAPTMRNGRPIQYTMITPPSESGIPAGQSYRGHTAADPAIISFPISRNASGSSKADQLPNDANLSDDESPAESTGKKHVCPTCMKRFNRPSSLRIHVNTHTGATPFRCPWPNCGREFNVNSNMRRHYRNHTTPGFSRAQPNDNRRKRRRLSAPQPLSYPMIPVDQSSHRRPHHPGVIMPSPPISHFSMSDDSDDESDMDGDSYTTGERDDSMQYNPRRRASPDYRAASGLAQSMARVAVAPAKYQHHGSHPYASSSRHSYPHDYTRPLTPVSSLHSSSPSPSHSPSPRPEAAHSNLYPPRKEYKYTASAPYVLSLADSRVSTALRPAFHSQSERSSSRPW